MKVLFDCETLKSVSFLNDESASSSTSDSHASRTGRRESVFFILGAQSDITEPRTPSDGHSYAHTVVQGGVWRDGDSA